MLSEYLDRQLFNLAPAKTCELVNPIYPIAEIIPAKSATFPL
jgi:hypothetical protein